MSEDLKNKFKDFEVKPPERVLNNLKKELGFTQKPFLVKHKYAITASLAGAVIALFLLFNDNKTTETKTITNKKIATTNIQNNINQEKPENLYNNKKTAAKQETANNNTNTDNLIAKRENLELSSDEENYKSEKQEKIVKNKNNYTKVNAGDDIAVCGGECVLGKNATAKSGYWLDNKSVKIANRNIVKTKVFANKTGKTQLVWVETKDNKIIGYDTITVIFRNNPNINYVVENEHCGRNDGDVIFETENQKLSFIWSDGYKTTNPERHNLPAGAYTIKISDNYGCEQTYEINIANTEIVNVDFYHTELYSAVNTPIYFVDRTKVNGIDKNELSYYWDFGDGTNSTKYNPEHIYKTQGEYEVSLTVKTKSGCSGTYKTTIKIDESTNPMPNVFTPNGDGINDVLVINPKPLANFKGMIFNRAGQLIYEWTDQYKGWDGNLKNGEQATEGVYYYVVTGIDSEGKKFQYKSFVHLSR